MTVEVELLSEEFGIKYIGLPAFAFFLVSIALVQFYPNVSFALFFIGLGYVITMAGFGFLLLWRNHVG